MAGHQDEIIKKPSEITKRRNNARRKDEITKCATRNDKKMPCEKNILNSYFSSFRLAFICLFDISRGVFSSFRIFAWRYFVFSPCHNAKRCDDKTKKHHVKRQKNEKMPRKKAKKRKNAKQKDEITKGHHAKRRNSKKTPDEK